MIKLEFGDKITKRPVKIGNELVFLGRLHIHSIELDTFKTKIYSNKGEDKAEYLTKIHQ